MVGLEKAKAILSQVVADRCHAHAILLYGAAGSGKTSIGKAMSQHWLCPNAGPEGPCGTCGVCTSFAKGRAVDFQHIHPGGPSQIITLNRIKEVKGSDGQDEVIPVRTFLRTRPLMSRNKVVMFEQAERMNGAAANALLKTLEEPTQHSKLILTAIELGSILPTIRSRALCIACEVPERPSADVQEFEKTFAATPGDLVKIRQSSEIYQRLYDFVQKVPTKSRGWALVLSQEARQIAEDLSKSSEMIPRVANAEIAACLARSLVKMCPEQPQKALAAAQAYKLIQGNGNTNLVFDTLFCTILD